MQKSFSALEYAGKREETHRDRFLSKMEEAVPWRELEAVIAPCYPERQMSRTSASRTVVHVARSCGTAMVLAVERGDGGRYLRQSGDPQLHGNRPWALVCA